MNKAVMLFKSLDQSTFDVDAGSRRVKVAFSKIGNIDHSKQAFAPHAWTRTVKDRGPQGTNEIWHQVDHTYSLTASLGKPKELYMGTAGQEQDYLIGVTDIAKTNLGNDILEHYRNGAITQHSVTFYTPQSERRIMKADSGEEYEQLGQSILWEGSSVLWGDNPDTPTFIVSKTLLAKEAINRIQLLGKCLRSGRYTDDFFGLIELQLKAIEQYIIDLETKSNVPEDTTHTETRVDSTKVDNAAIAAYFKNTFKL